MVYPFHDINAIYTYNISCVYQIKYYVPNNNNIYKSIIVVFVLNYVCIHGLFVYVYLQSLRNLSHIKKSDILETPCTYIISLFFSQFRGDGLSADSLISTIRTVINRVRRNDLGLQVRQKIDVFFFFSNRRRHKRIVLTCRQDNESRRRKKPSVHCYKIYK